MPLPLVLVTVDTLRADRLGCYGHAPADTPNLDALAARGLLFLDASTTAPTTLPAHASLLSGDWVHSHGVASNHDRVPAELELLPDQLARAGYATAAFVSGSPLSRGSGLASHFQHYDDQRPDVLGTRYPPERRAEHTVQAAMRWLHAAPDPFFLWIHLYDPHQPLTATRHAPDPYDAEIAEVDIALGALLAALATRGAAVVVASDHGEGLGEHGEAEHGVFLYQSTMRVPLIVSAPGLAPARRPEPVSLVDIAPTLLALAGLPEQGPGMDLRAPIPRDRVLHASTTHAWQRWGWAPLQSVRKGSWKAIEAPRSELYDLAQDAAERRNRYPGDGSWAALFPELELAGEGARGELAQQLIALGYAASEPAPTASAPDPKDRIALLPKLEAASAALHAGKPAEVEALLGPVLLVDADNPAALNDLGLAQLQLEKYPQAVVTLRHAAERTPTDARVWSNLGLAARRAGDLPLARTSYARAAELDPTFAAPCYNRAALELDAGDQTEARRWAEEALRRAPGMTEAQELLKKLP